MSEPFVGEIRAFGMNYAPRGWAMCNGQLLMINQNQALYSILGNTYGGDGRTTFALPDLRGRVPVHAGNSISYGQSAGEESHALTVNEMPPHIHTISASSGPASDKAPANKVWAKTDESNFAAAPNNTMSTAALTNAGESRPHNNMQPYNTINFCIALQGIYPSRN
jgi:microcystin-dependent protein